MTIVVKTTDNQRIQDRPVRPGGRITGFWDPEALPQAWSNRFVITSLAFQIVKQAAF